MNFTKIKNKIATSRVGLTARMLYYNGVCKPYIKMFGKRDTRNLKYKISLCLIFKNEAPFLKEWLDYHLTVGVDHFYLYNNNSDDNFMEVLQPYIAQQLVTLIDWPYEKAQFKAYKHFYETYRGETNWVSFLDADEFFVPRYAVTIGEWLKPFEKYPAVVVHWRIFGTGGLVEHDYSKNVIEQYFVCWDRFYKFGKCLINTRYDISDFDIWHMHHHTYMKYPIFGIRTTLPAVNQFKYICTVDKIWGGGKDKMRNSTMMCNHYYTKSWNFYKAKMAKTDVLYGNSNPRSKMSQFFKMEDFCNSSDHTICKFLVRMRLLQEE